MQIRYQALARPLAAAVLAGSLATAQAADIVTGATDLGMLTSPVTLTYSHAFNDTDPLTAGLQLAGVPGTVLATDRFYDDYAFQIGGSFASAITATIDLGTVFDISNLQVRLYEGTLQTMATGPVGPALLAAWSAQNLIVQGSGSGDVQVIAPITLGPGSYLLEVRGNITGTSGGAYAGVLNLSPIPEPGAVGMMLAGLGMLGFMARRRRG
jgi:PEP-CTERM motif